MADALTGNTELVATKNDLIIALVQKELKFQAKLPSYVTDFSAFAGKGMKSIKVPRFTGASAFTVTNRASEAAVDSQAMTSAVDTINLDYRAHINWIIDADDELESSVEVQMEYAKRAATAHSRYLDTELVSKLEAAATDFVGPISRDKVLDMREFLLKNDADMSQLVLAIHPDQEKAMLKISEFTQAQIYGNAVIPSGVIGQVYGVPVLIHNGLAAGKSLMWEKSGIGLAFQRGVQMSNQLVNQYGTNTQRVAMDQKYGIGALQLGEKGLAGTKSPLICGLLT